ncbi:MAG: DUF47 family protein [Acidobacteriota bacterium]
MAFNLLGTEFAFSNLFQAQYARLSEAVSLLRDAFEEKPGMAETLKRIQAIEAEARRESREITRQLSLTLIRPIERDDIHDLNQAFELAITAVKAVSTRVGLYRVQSMPGSAKEVAECVGEVVIEIGTMMRKLSTRHPIGTSAERVDQIVDEADAFLLVGLGEVYEMRLTGPETVLDIVKWGQIYDRLEEAVDRVEDVANVIEGMVLKNV